MSDLQIERGCCGAMWHSEYLHLPYQYEPVSQYQLANYVEQGYESVKSFTGERYTDENKLPNFIADMKNLFSLFDQRYEFFKVRPLDIAPPYNLNVNFYMKKFNVDRNDVWHTVVMVENWQPGQHIEINGRPFVQWNQGDWFKWKNTPDSTFSYANFGVYNMYMIHVTGRNTYTGQLHDLYTMNFPGKHDNTETSHPFFALSIVPEINPTRDGPPSAVYMDNGNILQLDKIELNSRERQELIDNKFDIYLFEVMGFYLDGQEHDSTIAKNIEDGGTKHTQGFYSEFSPPYDFEKIRSDELDSILAFHKKWDLPSGTITVHTGEYNIEGKIPYYEKDLNIVCDDLYVRTLTPIPDLVVDTQEKPTRHFVSLNWRFTKHRQLLANFLAGENGHLSWYFKNEFDILNKGLWFNLDEWEEKYPKLYEQLKVNNQNIKQQSPFMVDKKCTNVLEVDDEHFVPMWPDTPDFSPGVTPSMWNSKRPDLKEIYEQSFVDIVTETRLAQPYGNYSEKVLQPIQYKKPFILLAPPHTLKYLKEHGYQTFDKWWNEDYDECEDHGERLAKIFTIIQDILMKPMIELGEMYKEMSAVVEHNHNNFMARCKYPNWTKTEDYD